MSDAVSGARATCADPAYDPSAQGTEACTNEAPICSQGLLMATDQVADSEERPSVAANPAPWGLRFCREADTVVEGFLCDEPVVVSNACRQPTNSFDAYVCDEPRMRSLERSVVRQTLSVLKTLLLEFLGW
jgi:hypothetical protein